MFVYAYIDLMINLKDRRPISPLPFLRLRISDENGPVDIQYDI